VTARTIFRAALQRSAHRALSEAHRGQTLAFTSLLSGNGGCEGSDPDISGHTWEKQAMVGRAKTDGGERRKLEAELDKALAQTFPASDPYSVGQFTSTEPPSRPVDRQAPELPFESAGLPPRRRKRRASH
jgi:hypothetical protein